MMIRIRVAYITFGLCVMVCAGIYVPSAHGALQGIPQSAVEITLSPRYPGPNDIVTATMKTNHVNLSTADVTWTVNGAVVQRTTGGSSYTFTAGPLGTVTKLRASASGLNGRTIATELTLRISDVSIAWEGRTYTPPLYQGRSYQSPGSEVALVAIPSIVNDAGALIPVEKLTFVWYFVGKTTPAATKRGDATLTVTNPEPFMPLTMMLEVRDSADATRAQTRVEIPVEEPLLLLYESHPLYGINYSRALRGTHDITGNEVTLFAEPLYMSTPKRSDATLAYEWSVGGERYDNAGSIVLRPEGAGSGSARISLAIKNLSAWRQSARADLSMSFSAVSTQNAEGNTSTIAP